MGETMNAKEFQQKIDNSIGLRMIIAGLTGLIDDEGYTPREVFELMDGVRKHIYPVLLEVGKENK